MSDHAPFLDMPNYLNPEPHAPAHYGKTPVPHPCNERAKMTDHAKVMRAVNEGK